MIFYCRKPKGIVNWIGTLVEHSWNGASGASTATHPDKQEKATWEAGEGNRGRTKSLGE